MASGKSNYLRNALLNLVLGGESFSPPDTTYVALSTAMWTASATGDSIASSEPSSANGYARVPIPNTTGTWPTSTTGSKANAVVVNFPPASGDWGTLQSFYVVDASSGGNILYGGDLYTARAVLTGDAARFAPNQLNVSEA